MHKENKILNEDAVNDKDLNFEDLDEMLQSQLEESMSDFETLGEEFEQIGNPDALGETIKNVVWEQFLNQIAVTAGEDFIRDNRELLNRGKAVDRSTTMMDVDVKKYHLDLSKDAHIQTAENFEKQKYAKHNTYIDYEARGKEYRSNFYTDPNKKPNAKQKQEQRYNEETKVWETYDPVDGEWKKSLQPDYRKPYEADRQKNKKNKVGSKSVPKDHQVADATVARDAEAGAYMEIDEKVSAANSEDNLYDLKRAANESKNDHDGEKWAKHKRTGKSGKGLTNAEYFGIDEEEYIEQDKKAKKAYEEKKRRKRDEEIALGKKSQKEEAFRIGGKALRAMVMQLLADLVKEIIKKLILWFKSKDKSLGTLIDSIKEAIHSFVSKLKTHIVNATNTLITTIATAIIGPVVGTVKKVWMMLKQGVKSIKGAIIFLKNPENKNMPIGLKLLEVGKIVMAGVSGAGAIILGEVIGKALMGIPGFAVEIPLIGSLANVIGIFMGAVVAGIIGALAIRMIDNATAKVRKSINLAERVEKGNEVLKAQQEMIRRTDAQLAHTRADIVDGIKRNHTEAVTYIKEVIEEIEHEDEEFSRIVEESKKDSKERLDFDSLDDALDGLFNE